MSGLPQAWKAMFKEKERLAATVLTYLGRDECGRRESGSHGLADRNAFRSSGDHFGPGQKCFPLKRRPFQTGTKVLSAQAATIPDRDRSAFRPSGDHSGPGQKCFPPKRRPFQTGTEMLSAQAATISDPKSILSGTSGRHINDRSL